MKLSIVNYQLSIATLVVAMSFLLLTACSNFPENNSNMPLTLTVQDGSVQLSGNPVWVNVTTPTSGMTNHRLLLKVTCITEINLPVTEWILDIPIDTESEADFNIQSYIDLPFNYEFDYEIAVMANARDMLLLEFTVDAGESYVDGTGAYSGQLFNEAPETIFVVKGKLPQTELAALIKAEKNFYSHYIQGMRFLSFMGYSENEQEKIIHVNKASDPVKMWFMVYDVVPDFLDIHVRCTDGSAEHDEYSWEWVTANKFVEFNGNKLCDLANLDQKEVDYYEITVKKGTASYGKMKVIVDNINSEVHDELYILNTSGAVEVVNCYGDISESLNTEKETYTKPASKTPTIFDATVIAKNGNTKEPFEVNTGYKLRLERQWIKQLLKAEQAWLKSERLPHLIGKSYGFVPVVIPSGSYKIDTTTEDLLPIDIHLQIAHVD